MVIAKLLKNHKRIKLNLMRGKVQVFVFYYIYFLVIGLISQAILTSDVSITTMMQIFAVAIVVILLIIKFIIPKISAARKLAWILTLIPVVFIIYFLVFSTGVLSSPFLILTQFFAIGIAFLLSTEIGLSYIIATLTLFLLNIKLIPETYQNAVSSPISTVLNLLAYIAIVPFSYFLSKQYKVKEEWANILEKQITTSKSQEEEVLKNITDAVIVIDKSFRIIYLNQAAIKNFKYGQEIVDKRIFDFFKLRDENGIDLQPYALPFEQTISSKTQSTVHNIQISAKDKAFRKFNIKLIPAIGTEGVLGLILVLEQIDKNTQLGAETSNLASQTLKRFLFFLERQDKTFSKIANQPYVESLKGTNKELKNLASDYIFALSLDLGDIGAISSLIDLGEILDKVALDYKKVAQKKRVNLIKKGENPQAQITPVKSNLTLEENKKLFPQIFAIGNEDWIYESTRRIIELAINLAAEGTDIAISLQRKEGLGVIKISTKTMSQIPGNLTSDLFEKFYGRLKDMKELQGTSGIDTYIAKSLITRMGGNIFIDPHEVYPLTITITFGETNIASYKN